MSEFKKLNAEAQKQIRYRERLILMLFCICFMLGFGWHRTLNDITVHIPPDLRSGASVKQGESHPAYIFGFAGEFFTYLNTWNKDGQYDYEGNTSRLRAVLTQKYRKEIRKEIKELMDTGELQGRTRIISPITEDYYTDKKVKVVNKSTWVVTRKYRVREYLKNSKIPIKDIFVEFPIRVIVYKVPIEANPWQLGLDGFESKPKRIVYLKGELE